MIKGKYSNDFIAQIRRANDLSAEARRLGIVINNDGSVFDNKTKKTFHNLVEWSREVSYEIR